MILILLKIVLYNMAIVDIKTLEDSSSIRIPIFASNIAAGFPSPADDYIEDAIDLNKHLVEHPSATFFVRVKGSSMEGAGINDGDVLIVDRSLKAKSKSIIVAIVDGELTVKRLKESAKKVFLVPENSNYSEVEITSDRFEIWGVVTYIIHKAK